jgi:hypothetical protein
VYGPHETNKVKYGTRGKQIGTEIFKKLKLFVVDE